MSGKKQRHTLSWLMLAVLVVLSCVLGARAYESFQEAPEDSDDASIFDVQQTPQAENSLPPLINTTSKFWGFKQQDIEPFNREVLEEVIRQDGSSDAFEFHLYAADKNLIDCVAETLNAYEQIDNLSVEVSGYLDLFGDVWGCMLRREMQWIDVVIVESDEYDEHSYLSIMRIRPTSE